MSAAARHVATRSTSPAQTPAQTAAQTAAQSRPALRLAPPPSPRTTAAAFVASCAGLLALTLVCLLGLNIAVSANAFVLDDLSNRASVLEDREEALRLSVAREAAPQRLDMRARTLGMVPVEAPVLLSVPAPDGATAGPPAGPPGALP